MATMIDVARQTADCIVGRRGVDKASKAAGCALSRASARGNDRLFALWAHVADRIDDVHGGFAWANYAHRARAVVNVAALAYAS